MRNEEGIYGKELIYEKVSVTPEFDAMVGDYSLIKEQLEDDPFYRSLLALAGDQIQAESVALFLLNTEEEHLEVVISRPDVSFLGFKQPLDRGIVSMVVWSEHGVSISDVSEHNMFDDTADRTREFKTESMMATPLLLRGRVMGVLSAVNKREALEFSDDDMKRLALVADAMKFALQARILDRLVQI